MTINSIAIHTGSLALYSTPALNFTVVLDWIFSSYASWHYTPEIATDKAGHRLLDTMVSQ